MEPTSKLTPATAEKGADPARSPGWATLYAVTIAFVLLVTAVLPAEYGIDVSGAGRLLGLTPMGERKVAAAKIVSAANAAPIAATNPAGATATTVALYSTVTSLPLRHDEIEVKLAPQGQIEYKAVLDAGEFLVFDWDAGGVDVKFDFHGEPSAGPEGAFLTFHKGSASKSGGSLKAPFAGTHGWYWKNATDKNVVIKLRVSGFYTAIKKL